MKWKISYLIAVIVMLASCSDDVNTYMNCSLITKNLDWPTYKFNETYTIKYPDSYIGGMEQWVGAPIFRVRRNDERVTLSGGFCDPAALPCHGYNYHGEGIDINAENSYFDEKLTICDDGTEIGYFYHTENGPGTFRNASGSIVLLDLSDSEYKFAGSASFSSDHKDEVLTIIESIKLK